MNKQIIFILLILPFITQAQVISDAKLWTNISIAKKMNDFEFSFNHETRFDENISHIDKSFFELGAKYKITKGLYGLFGYRFSRDNDYETINYDLKQRFDFGLSYRYKYEKFRFGVRTKYQTKTANSYENNPSFWRNKFTVKYKLDQLTPFVSYEFFYQFNDQKIINRIRISTGSKITITKNSDIKVFYIFENRFNTNLMRHNHIYGIGYNIEI